MRPDLLDAIEAAVFVARRGADDHLVIEFANAAFRAAADLCEKVTGLPAESVMPAAWVGAVAEAAARGSAELPPARLPGWPGMFSGVVRRLADGEPARVVGTLSEPQRPADIDAEAADILDLQSEMVCRWRPNGTVYYCNAAYARVCGREKAEVVGANLADVTPAVELSQIFANVRRLGPESPIAAYDHRVPQPDGTERWQEWIDQALFGPDGRTVVAYQSTGRDITHRKLAEEGLWRSQQRLQLALVAGNQGVWEFDVEQGALSSDPVIDRRLGLAAGNGAGQGNLPDWDGRLHPDDRARVSAAFDRLVDGVTDRFAEEYRIRRQDGGYYWVFDNAVAVGRDENRRRARIVGTSADVDARHRADEAAEGERASACASRSRPRSRSGRPTSAPAWVRIDAGRRPRLGGPGRDRVPLARRAPADPPG
jgi:PAS domain S-box-containing protein